jgi:hypothetical protein
MKSLSVVLLLTLLLVGCGTEPTATPVQDTPLATAVAPTPTRPAPTPTEPVPTPTEPAPTPTESAPTPVPTPSADKGAIVGRFVDFETGEPPRTVMPVFLGQLSPLDPGDSFVITMLPTTAPQTGVDTQGYFAFSDVEPDTYALVFWTPINSWVVSDPETEEAILVTVNAGEITDLGEMAVNLPGQP